MHIAKGTMWEVSFRVCRVHSRHRKARVSHTGDETDHFLTTTEIAAFLTKMSSSPVRRPVGTRQTPPQSPYFAPFLHGGVGNPSSSLCDTPVPVTAQYPMQSPLPDSSKNVLSPIPIDATFERERAGVEALSQLRDTSQQRKTKPHRHLFNEAEDDDSSRSVVVRLSFSPPNSPGMVASLPSISNPPLELASSSTHGSNQHQVSLMAVGHMNPNVSRGPQVSSPAANNVSAGTPRTSASGLGNPKTPQSQTASGKRRRTQTRGAVSGLKVVSSQEEDDDDDEESGEENGVSPDGSNSPKPCKCKKSRCLKLYCDCFGANRVCVKSCTCQDCHNTDRPEHKADRQEAIQQVLDRNPQAFTSKILETSESAQHAKGCHCKRSNCLKRYCECYALQVRCTAACKCVDCLNYAGSEALESPAVGSASKSLVGSSSKKKRPSSEKKPQLSPRKSGKKGTLQEAFKLEDDGETHATRAEVDEPPQKAARGADSSTYTGGPHVQFMIPSEKIPGIASFSYLDDMVGGDQSMDSVAFYSSQESKGSLSSRRDPSAKEKLIPWGHTSLTESLTKRCFEWLDDQSLIRAANVSRGFAEVATSPNMWHYPESQSTQGSQ